MEGERAASETVGAVLMVAIVVVSVSALSVGLVAMRTTGPTAPQVSLHAAVSPEYVAVTNTGGASLDASALRVVVRKQDGTQVAFTLDPANVSGTDDQFDPGETFRRTHGLALSVGDRATVLVVHEPSATVLVSATLVVRENPDTVVYGPPESPIHPVSSTPVERPIDKPI